jgi:hypothetical protein
MDIALEYSPNMVKDAVSFFDTVREHGSKLLDYLGSFGGTADDWETQEARYEAAKAVSVERSSPNWNDIREGSHPKASPDQLLEQALAKATRSVSSARAGTQVDQSASDQALISAAANSERQLHSLPSTVDTLAGSGLQAATAYAESVRSSRSATGSINAASSSANAGGGASSGRRTSGGCTNVTVLYCANGSDAWESKDGNCPSSLKRVVKQECRNQ